MSDPRQAAPPEGDGDSESILDSLEAMLAEVGSRHDERRHLLAGAAPGPSGGAARAPAEDPRIAALRARIEKARAGLARRDARIAELKAERDALRAERDRILSSRSWRLTAPLRRLRG